MGFRCGRRPSSVGCAAHRLAADSAAVRAASKAAKPRASDSARREQSALCRPTGGCNVESVDCWPPDGEQSTSSRVSGVPRGSRRPTASRYETSVGPLVNVFPASAGWQRTGRPAGSRGTCSALGLDTVTRFRALVFCAALAADRAGAQEPRALQAARYGRFRTRPGRHFPLRSTDNTTFSRTRCWFRGRCQETDRSLRQSWPTSGQTGCVGGADANPSGTCSQRVPEHHSLRQALKQTPRCPRSGEPA